MILSTSVLLILFCSIILFHYIISLSFDNNIIAYHIIILSDIACQEDHVIDTHSSSYSGGLDSMPGPTL